MSNKKDAGGSDAGASDANTMLIEACEDGDLRKAKIALKKMPMLTLQIQQKKTAHH